MISSFAELVDDETVYAEANQPESVLNAFWVKSREGEQLTHVLFFE